MVWPYLDIPGFVLKFQKNQTSLYPMAIGAGGSAAVLWFFFYLGSIGNIYGEGKPPVRRRSPALCVQTEKRHPGRIGVPCEHLRLSPWERWPSAARTERENNDHIIRKWLHGPLSHLRRQFSQRESWGAGPCYIGYIVCWHEKMERICIDTLH